MISKRKLFAVSVLALLLVSMFAGLGVWQIKPAHATGITRVQGPVKTSGYTNSLAVTLTWTPTSGNVLILCLALETTVTSVTQTGVVWHEVINSTAGYSHSYTYIYIGIVGSGASTGLTVATGSSGGIVTDVCEYVGVETSSYTDKTASANDGDSSGTTTDTGTTATTTMADELWVGAVGLANGGASVNQTGATNGFTLLDGVPSGYGDCLGYLEKIVSSMGTANSNTTLDSASYWGGCIATFKASGLSTLSVSLILPSTGGTHVNGTSNGLISFVYTPITFGSDIQNATLWCNATGSWVAAQGNTTTVVNSAQNTINYSSWPSLGVIVWNIKVWNTTHGVFAVANYTFTLVANTGLLPYTNNWISASQMRGVGLGPEDIQWGGVNANWTLMAKTLASYGINFFSIGGFSNYKTVYQSVYPNIPCEFDPPVNYTEMINAFHSYGIKVIAGVTAMLGVYSGDGIDRNSYWTNTNISGITEYPYSGGWLDIANPASTALLYNLTNELVSNYSIDGMNFDYLRWDDWLMPLGNYDMADFQAMTGLDVGVNYSTWLQDVLPVYYPYTSTLTGGNGKYWSQLLEWRNNLVTRLLQNITEWALAINPNLTFGCTPHLIPSDSEPDHWPVQQGQDPANWVRLGLIQWLAPMYYPSDGSNATVDAYIADMPNVIHRQQNFITGGAHGQVALIPAITDGGAGWGFNVSSDRMVTWINTMIANGADGWLLLGYGGAGTPPTSGDPNSTVIFDALGLPNPVTFVLDNVTATALSGASEQISWTTSSAVNTIVQYNPTPLFSWSQLNATGMIASGFPYWKNTHTEYYIASNSTVDTNHVITLVGLTPNITYYFRVMSVDASGTAFSSQLTFSMTETNVIATIISPTNTTYTSPTVPVQVSATGGTIDTILWNCTYANGTVAYANTVYTVPTSMTLGNGSYVFNAYANNTLGEWDEETVMFTVAISASSVTIVITSPANMTYTSSSISISMSASGGTIDTIWWNVQFENSSWLYAENQTYTTATSVTIGENVTATFYGYANNTDGNSDEGSVVFTVYLAPNTFGYQLSQAAIAAAGFMGIVMLLGMVYVGLEGKDVEFAVMLAVGEVLLLVTMLILSQLSILG